ncbi:SDR family NAD(P)-dependent oxidoreductase [Comamonadaceae bacterium G21597-S1]|nr:SDR family NAD(P)-dependent oxidoreductase [Comamonadaceae bacterium G21597-S1]
MTARPQDDLRGRTAIVTGAGKGLGRAYALHLARLGARVLVNNRRHAGESDADTSAQQTVEAIRAAGGTAMPDWSDVTDPDSGAAMVEQARRHFGRLDIVVANAGVDRASRFARQSMADFRTVFDTGFFGNLHLVHAAWPQLIEQRYGRVVLTTSSAGLYGNLGQAAYSAAKAAVIGLVRALAIEGRNQGVYVNAIAPYGYSQMTAPYMAPGMETTFDPQRVAPLVAWLAGAGCDVSGEVLVCGGGALRLAGVGETDALALPGADLSATIKQLHAMALHPHASATDSFTRLLDELPTAKKDTP